MALSQHAVHCVDVGESQQRCYRDGAIAGTHPFEHAHSAWDGELLAGVARNLCVLAAAELCSLGPQRLTHARHDIM